jgi:SAM-dependent methyltransferase
MSVPERPTESRPATAFEQAYARAADPWDYESSPYERAKYAATLAALPRPRYSAALELGCSIGVLTAALAARCDTLLAVDFAENALTRARARCAALPGVTFRRVTLPHDYPSGRFDLTILSEVGYYLSRDDLRAAVPRICGGLVGGGQLLLVHWTPIIDDAPLTGDEVHEEFLHHNGGLLDHLGGERTETYRLDLLARR